MIDCIQEWHGGLTADLSRGASIAFWVSWVALGLLLLATLLARRVGRSARKAGVRRILRQHAWHEDSPHILGALSAAYLRAKDLEGARTGVTPSDIEWSMRLTPNYWLTVQRRLGVLAEESECCKR